MFQSQITKALLGEVPTSCSKCGLPVRAGDATCPQCGTARPGLGMGSHGRILWWVFGLLLAGLVLYTVFVGPL